MVDALRFDVVLVALDLTRGSEIRKTRPCLVVSPDELNQALRTLIVAPMTTKGRAYPWRVAVRFQGKNGHIALDQMRTVDKQRIARRLAALDTGTRTEVLNTLANMFAE